MELILKQPPSLHLLFWKRLVSTQRIKALFLKEDCTSSSTLTTDSAHKSQHKQRENQAKVALHPLEHPTGYTDQGDALP